MLNVPFTTTRLQALLAGIGLVAVAAMAAGAAGYWLGHDAAKARGDAALTKLQRDQARAIGEATAAARDKEQALTRQANVLQGELIQARMDHAREAVQLKERIKRVTTQYRPAPGAPLVAAPRCVFTRGFVGVWNAAIGIGPDSVPEADSGPGAAEAAAASEALDSGLQPADLLDNLADNGQRARDIESQLNRLIDYVETEQKGQP